LIFLGARKIPDSIVNGSSLCESVKAKETSWFFKRVKSEHHEILANGRRELESMA
jgi:hypothetical protein